MVEIEHTLLLGQPESEFHSQLPLSRESDFQLKLQAAWSCTRYEWNRSCSQLFVSLAYFYPAQPEYESSLLFINTFKKFAKQFYLTRLTW